MADDYKAQLLAVEAKLAKDPENEELLTLKSDLIEIIELSGSLEEDEEQERQLKQAQEASSGSGVGKSNYMTSSYQPSGSSSSSGYPRGNSGRKYENDDVSRRSPDSQKTAQQNLVAEGGNLLANDGDNKDNRQSGQRRALTEAELLAKRKEKNRKKKAKLREKIKEQLDTAESVKQSWQSFANQRGLKGLNKRSIFASPCSVTGKVGVGTNGIADAAPTKGARSGAQNPSSSAPVSKRKY